MNNLKSETYINILSVILIIIFIVSLVLMYVVDSPFDILSGLNAVVSMVCFVYLRE